MTAPASRIHRRGFASMSAARRREIASRGGKRAHELGLAHEWTSEEAARAGRKGGLASGKHKPAAPLDAAPLD